MSKPTLADVFLADTDDTEGRCAVCGDEIEKWKPVVHIPAGYGPPNMVVLAHLHCAVRDDSIDLGVVFTNAWGHPAPKKARRG